MWNYESKSWLVFEDLWHFMSSQMRQGHESNRSLVTGAYFCPTETSRNNLVCLLGQRQKYQMECVVLDRKLGVVFQCPKSSGQLSSWYSECLFCVHVGNALIGSFDYIVIESRTLLILTNSLLTCSHYTIAEHINGVVRDNLECVSLCSPVMIQGTRYSC